MAQFTIPGSIIKKAWLILTALLATSIPATAQDAINPVLDDKFTFSLGFLRNEMEGEVTVLRQPLPETPIDVESVGLDTDQTSPWGHIRWRFGERWRLDFHYDRFDQDGKGKASKDFNFDGVVYPAGARIDTKFRADAYVFNIGYALWKQPNYELGLGLGLHGFDLDMGIKGTVRLGDKDKEIGSAAEELIAPVPNLRLFGIYAFTPALSLSASAGWLSASYDDWDGEFLYLRGLLDYRFSGRWGVGIGYQLTDVDIEHNRDNGDFEEYDVELSGIQGYISYSF